MADFTLLLLGPVRLLGANSAEVTAIGAKPLAMLAYLAGQPGREAGRDVLADLLWDGTNARHALRQSLLVLRRQFDASAMPVGAGPVKISLSPGVETDLARFESLLASRQIEAACALWRGPFCTGLDPAGGRLEEWLAAERARLAECAAGAFSELSRQAETEGRGQVAIAAAQRLLSLNPLDDTAQARLIALYRRQGSPEAARLAHRRCVGLYRRELGIAPGPEIQAAARTEIGRPGPRPPLPTPRRSARLWGRAAAAALLAAGLAWQGQLRAPMQADAAPVAWVGADEWQGDAVPDTKGLVLAEAISRGLAGDPEFAHLVPGGC